MQTVYLQESSVPIGSSELTGKCVKYVAILVYILFPWYSKLNIYTHFLN